ncbi:hypothetical protein L1049_026193 [Liquidambar formosana]|uniref:EF-hand domain-containing protein n=1 Tax=Liquidambar formosana TaxID=63359 RepID=A0AAP0NE98_LIQFO
MACVMMSPLNSNDLHRIFEKLDKNGDGLVCLEELNWLLERIGSISKRNHGKNEIVEEEDDVEGDLVKAFKVFDLNDDGQIKDVDEKTKLRMDPRNNKMHAGSNESRGTLRRLKIGKTQNVTRKEREAVVIITFTTEA